LALVVPTVVWAAPIANLLLGATYADSADVLRALAPFTFLTGFAPLVSLSVNYLGEARRRIPVAIALLVITAVLDLVLIPTVGLIGAAIATDVAYVFYVGAHLWICKRAVGLPLRPLAATVARCLVAAGAMAAVMAAFGVGKVGIPALLVGGALGLIVYVAVLVAVRAVSVEELRMAWDAVASRLRRRSDADPAT
jgi:O-antigen/teichoic acid export membrane protein